MGQDACRDPSDAQPAALGLNGSSERRGGAVNAQAPTDIFWETESKEFDIC